MKSCLFHIYTEVETKKYNQHNFKKKNKCKGLYYLISKVRVSSSTLFGTDHTLKGSNPVPDIMEALKCCYTEKGSEEKTKQKLLLRVNWCQAVRALVFNLSILGEFKANLVYKVSSKTVRAVTHRNTVKKRVNWIILALARPRQLNPGEFENGLIYIASSSRARAT